MTDSVLVSTAWLAAHLNDPLIRIVDIRGHVLPASEPLPHYYNHHEDYLKSHIPGAVFVDWVHEITDPADPRHAQIAPPARFEAVMRRIGLNPDMTVIAYDDAGGMFGARLWWALHYYGHEQVKVLDGGWTHWSRQNLPVTEVIPQYPMGTFEARSNPSWHRSGAEVLSKLHTASILVDMRSIEEFGGKSSRASRSGHIPGAVNQPRADLVSPDGSLLSPEALRSKFADLGVDNDSPEVIFYCNGGVSASFGLLAMRVAGITAPAAAYDGSWKDWGNDPDKPIESPVQER